MSKDYRKLCCDNCGLPAYEQFPEMEQFSLGWYVQWTCRCGATKCKKIIGSNAPAPSNCVVRGSA